MSEVRDAEKLAENGDEPSITSLASVLKPVTISLASGVKRSCKDCDHSAMEGKDRVCRFEPPKVAFLPMPGQQMVPGPGGLRAMPTMEVRPVSGFPVVQPDQWCSKFEARRYVA